jgi:hypothetical protein
MIHSEGPSYDHQAFKPWRIQALAFKAIRRLHPDCPLCDFAYEYENDKLTIVAINAGKAAVDDGDTVVTRLDRLARSTRDLLNTLAAIGAANAIFRSLHDAWADTTTPHGRRRCLVG